jgi:hypothetical protein
MKFLQTLFPVVALCLMAAAGARAGDVKVIANASVTSVAISADELRGVFLATKTSLGGSGHVEPVLLKGGAAHAAFLRQYVGKTDAAFETYYRSLIFTGKASMPATLASDAEMVAYVAKTKGAIGYVSADASSTGVKTMEVK